jgi:hypothetical protein
MNKEVNGSWENLSIYTRNNFERVLKMILILYERDACVPREKFRIVSWQLLS